MKQLGYIILKCNFKTMIKVSVIGWWNFANCAGYRKCLGGELILCVSELNDTKCFSSSLFSFNFFVHVIWMYLCHFQVLEMSYLRQKKGLCTHESQSDDWDFVTVNDFLPYNRTVTCISSVGKSQMTFMAAFPLLSICLPWKLISRLVQSQQKKHFDTSWSWKQDWPSSFK